MSSGPSTIQQTSKYVPSKGERPLYNAAYEQAYGYNQNPQGMYPGQTFVGASPFTQGGLYGMAASAAPIYGMQNPALQSWTRGTDVSNVASNPYVQTQMQANASQVGDTLRRQWLPSIKQGAVQAGGMNNVRQGVAEGQAIGDASEALANANAGTMLGAYGQGLAHERGMLGLSDAVTGLVEQPAQQLLAAGLGMEGYQEKALADAVQRYYWPRTEGEDRLDDMLQRLSAMRLGTQVNEQPNPYATSGLTNALGILGGIGSIGLPGGTSVGGTLMGKLLGK